MDSKAVYGGLKVSLFWVFQKIILNCENSRNDFPSHFFKKSVVTFCFFLFVARFFCFVVFTHILSSIKMVNMIVIGCSLYVHFLPPDHQVFVGTERKNNCLIRGGKLVLFHFALRGSFDIWINITKSK